MSDESSVCIGATLQRIQRDIDSYDEYHNPQVLDHLMFQLDILYYHLLVIGVDDAIPQGIFSAIAALAIVLEVPIHGVPQALPMTPTNSRGRPRLDISEDQLTHLLSLNFTCPAIATMLGVSLRTIRRRMLEYGLSVSSLYSTITDAELDEAVTSLKDQYRIMNGLLQQQGIRVTQMRIRDSMH